MISIKTEFLTFFSTLITVQKTFFHCRTNYDCTKFYKYFLYFYLFAFDTFNSGKQTLLTRMGMFHPIKSLVVSRNLWLILLSKICSVLNLVKPATKNLWNSEDCKSIFIFSLASVFVEFLAILWFFNEFKFQNISGTDAATCSLYYKHIKIINDASSVISMWCSKLWHNLWSLFWWHCTPRVINYAPR